jgi:hypothetical protein
LPESLIGLDIGRIGQHNFSGRVKSQADDLGDEALNWRTKARIQNLVARLPVGLSDRAYYLIQRTAGNLRQVDPLSRLKGAIQVVRILNDARREIDSGIFLEVGTGRQLSLPIGLWLCGAPRVVTIDLNRYLKPSLVWRDIAFVRENRPQVCRLFGELAQKDGFQERLSRLLEFTSDLGRLQSMMNVSYLAPADARAMNLEPQSIDFHISYTVLEHIPPNDLQKVMREGVRVLKPEGLFVHFVDFSDHFSHTDDSIGSVNFLRFSEKEWAHYAGNRYMYHNRLRLDDLQQILRSTGIEVMKVDPVVDPKALDSLRSGFPLAAQFQKKPPEINAIASAWIVGRKEDAS